MTPTPRQNLAHKTRNIPDNNLSQDKILCTIDLKNQDKKIAAVSPDWGNCRKITVLYPVCRLHSQPAGRRPPACSCRPDSQQEEAHPPQRDHPPQPVGKTAKF
ncbi:hypothetical protein DSO57_1032756 [Entomophthora muscae]|uniref:Uncharacterized protein n=1 Tax=Entomophthora muscae TaxID=34485 RepID=A0ACC2TC94_9FUNG|nr:hypothetical protein DSO57_1032756 [Entomophthora muscae]